LTGSLERVVTVSDTANVVGSGDVPVLATPVMLAWIEAATVAAIGGHLDAGETSVGSRVVLEHRVASAIGSTLMVTAELVRVDGRLLVFSVVARHTGDRIVAVGEVTRVVVERDRLPQRV
jgi:predicted thioesterase